MSWSEIQAQIQGITVLAFYASMLFRLEHIEEQRLGLMGQIPAFWIGRNFFRSGLSGSWIKAAFGGTQRSHRKRKSRDEKRFDADASLA